MHHKIKKKSNIIKVRKIWLRINTIFIIIKLSYTWHSYIRSNSVDIITFKRKSWHNSNSCNERHYRTYCKADSHHHGFSFYSKWLKPIGIKTYTNSFISSNITDPQYHNSEWGYFTAYSFVSLIYIFYNALLDRACKYKYVCDIIKITKHWDWWWWETPYIGTKVYSL